MRPATACAVLALGLALAPVAAQTPQSEAYSHILSAFTTRADPRVLADAVALGPALRRELPGESDGGRVYRALLERAGDGAVRVRALTPEERERYAVLAGVSAGDPLFALQAGELTLLLQYAPGRKRVSFVEQLRGPAPRAAVPAPAPALVPVAAPPAPPRVIAVPPAAPAREPAPALRPAGACVVKPVMSEQDLVNCGVRR